MHEMPWNYGGIIAINTLFDMMYTFLNAILIGNIFHVENINEMQEKVMSDCAM
jgi:hypothetical protein